MTLALRSRHVGTVVVSGLVAVVIVIALGRRIGIADWRPPPRLRLRQKRQNGLPPQSARSANRTFPSSRQS
jgi:hypothetical protein